MTESLAKKHFLSLLV